MEYNRWITNLCDTKFMLKCTKMHYAFLFMRLVARIFKQSVVPIFGLHAGLFFLS